MKICKNCGLRKECEFVVKETYHCSEWIPIEEKELKLESKDGEEFEFKKL